MEDCKKAYRKALNTFAIDTWPNDIDNLMFPYKWNVKLAKCGIFIKSLTDFIKALNADYDPMA